MDTLHPVVRPGSADVSSGSAAHCATSPGRRNFIEWAAQGLRCCTCWTQG